MGVVIMQYLSYPRQNGEMASLCNPLNSSFDLYKTYVRGKTKHVSRYKIPLAVICFSKYLGKCLWPRLRKNLPQSQIHPGR